MQAIFLVLATLVLIWSWALCGIAGVGLLLRAFCKGRGYWLSVGLILLTAAWYYVALPYTFGVRSHTIRSADGRSEAWLMQTGVSTNLRVRRGDKEVLIHLHAGFARPENVFWIEDGETIGVDYGDDSPDRDKIANVGLYFKEERDVTKKDVERMHFKKPMTPPEQAAFERAKQAMMNDE